MKAVRHLARLEPMVLDPLRDLARDAWHRAPSGKWTIAQIVHHLALGIDATATLFEKRANRTDLYRRSKPYQNVLRHLVLLSGRFPSGFKTIEATRPAEHPDPELISAQFRMGVARLQQLHEDWPLERQRAIYVRHPILGDLNLPEWARFHFIHCRHHARQIAERLAWIERGKGQRKAGRGRRKRTRNRRGRR